MADKKLDKAQNRELMFEIEVRVESLGALPNFNASHFSSR